MIDYTPFWETLKRQHESWYTMTRNHNVGFSTLHRLKNNKDISTKTINDLCKKLQGGRYCSLYSLRYRPDTMKKLVLSLYCFRHKRRHYTKYQFFYFMKYLYTHLLLWICNILNFKL